MGGVSAPALHEALLVSGREFPQPPSKFLLRQNLKTAAMLWPDQLEVTTIKRENARDVQTFRYRDDQRVYKI